MYTTCYERPEKGSRNCTDKVREEGEIKIPLERSWELDIERHSKPKKHRMNKSTN